MKVAFAPFVGFIQYRELIPFFNEISVVVLIILPDSSIYKNYNDILYAAFGWT